MENNDYIR